MDPYQRGTIYCVFFFGSGSTKENQAIEDFTRFWYQKTCLRELHPLWKNMTKEKDKTLIEFFDPFLLS